MSNVDLTSFTTKPIAQAEVREQPHNIEAEQGLLGAILINNRAFEKVSDFLQADHFSDPIHGRIFEACGKLIERGQIANPVTLKPLFDSEEALADSGGAQYLVQLAASVVTVVNAEDYGRSIKDSFLRRELIDIGEEVVNNAYNYNLDQTAVSQIEIAEAQLFSLAENDSAEGGLRNFSEASLYFI